jgi:hypothetical protein
MPVRWKRGLDASEKMMKIPLGISFNLPRPNVVRLRIKAFQQFLIA